MCKFCDENRYYEEFVGESGKPYISIFLVNLCGNIFIRADGDNTDFYHPKYCPECGRRLKFEDES